jgi:mono/diheme cytochrome c family protein
MRTILAAGTLLISCYTFTASAHEKEHHVTPQTAASDVPLLEWASPAFNAAEKLYQTAGSYGCAACHGQFAQGGGNIGGNIRNHSLEQINTALRQQPVMQLLDKALSSDDRIQLASYLKSLGQYQLVEWTIEGDESYHKISVKKEDNSQLVIFNKTFEPLALSLEPIRSDATIDLPPYATESFRWKTKPGLIRLQYKQNILDIDAR